ncbi:MAG: Mut7-C RNAse domain-containing protein, partial [Pyrobaculum sp.]
MVDCLIKGGGDYDCVYVDSMLGWLAKMLRIVFGLVVYYKNDVDDSELLQTKCLVVTRDWELFRQR